MARWVLTIWEMDTAKPQAHLRSPDIGVRPAGIDRSPPTTTEGKDFLSRLSLGLSEVQRVEAQARRDHSAAVEGHTVERGTDPTRDRGVDARPGADRREPGSRRLEERRAKERQAGRRRGEEPERARGRRQEAADAQEVQPAPTDATAPDRGEGSAAAGAHKDTSSTNTPGVSGGALQSQGQQGQAGSSPAALTQGPGSTIGAVTRPASGAAVAPAPAAAMPESTRRPSPTPRGAGTGRGASDLERAEAVLRQVKVSLRPGIRSASIQLHPAELGRISIRLRIKEEGIQAVIRAESEGALSVLERHVPELRAMLEQQGFEGAEFDLGLASESDKDSDQNSEGGQSATHDEEIDLDPTALAGPLAAAEGGVDLIA